MNRYTSYNVQTADIRNASAHCNIAKKMRHLLLLLVKIINNHANEEIECEERTKYNEHYEERVIKKRELPDWLLIEL